MSEQGLNCEIINGKPRTKAPLKQQNGLDTHPIEALQDNMETEQESPMKVIDTRVSPDATQQSALEERLKLDDVATILIKVKEFLGAYSSTTKPSDLVVNILDGNNGEGTIKGATIEVQMSSAKEAVRELGTQIGTLLENVPEAYRSEKYQAILMAIIASTILHEGIHGLIDSKPTSKLAIDFEKISGLPNINGTVSTLLDEGIAYAIQANFAPEIEPLGSLAPSAKDTDPPDVHKRKILGEKLRPKVQEYLQLGKKIDEDFLRFSADRMKEVL